MVAAEAGVRLKRSPTEPIYDQTGCCSKEYIVKCVESSDVIMGQKKSYQILSGLKVMKALLLFFMLMTYSLHGVASKLSDSNALFDWAEINYPQYFNPSSSATETIGDYFARFYPKTKNYIGTLGNDVYVLGDVFGEGVIKVGIISDFIKTTTEAYIESENFTGTILVKKNNSDVLRKGFGFADKSQQIHNSLDTRYRIGSLTKAFTALAIVQLKNANKIGGYDDPVSNYIQNYPRGKEITIRQLLTHRSGIPEYLPKVIPSKNYSPSELIALFNSEPLAFESGQQFSYSNSNYILLGYLIELLSGQSYEDYLKNNIFNTLDMFNTEYGTNTIAGIKYGKGYRSINQSQLADFIDMTIPYSAGALTSSAIDMGVWANSFLTKRLFSETDAEEIFSEDSYGFGWITIQIHGKLAYLHTGAINGFSSIIAIFPKENSYIVALSNVEGENEKLKRIVKYIVEHEL